MEEEGRGYVCELAAPHDEADWDEVRELSIIFLLNITIFESVSRFSLNITIFNVPICVGAQFNRSQITSTEGITVTSSEGITASTEGIIVTSEGITASTEGLTAVDSKGLTASDVLTVAMGITTFDHVIFSTVQ